MKLDTANSTIFHLEETIEALHRENKMLREQNEKFQSAMLQNGNDSVGAITPNSTAPVLKKKKRLRTTKPIAFLDTDLSDD